jgi:hypothetical protein
MRRLRTSILLSLGTFLWIGACGDKDGPASCEPGSVKTCATPCSGSTSGIQVCAGDGKSYGRCTCEGEVADGGVGGSSSGSSGPVTSTAAIGAACSSDSNCAAGLRCLLASGNDFGTSGSSLSGGPSGGYCTKDCTDSAECQAIDVASDCEPVSDTGSICLRTCLSKDPTSGENKCLNRSTLACNSTAVLQLEAYSSDRQDGWCLPLCGSDSDCGGRTCNLTTGLCSDTANEGLPIGAPCTADSPACAGGLCLPVTDTIGFCSAACRLTSLGAGAVSGCGYGRTANPREAACLSPYAGVSNEDSEGLGDIGVCLELCDVPADCGQSGWRCVIETGVEELLGRAGYCLPPLDETPDAGQPPAGDASVAVDSGT